MILLNKFCYLSYNFMDDGYFRLLRIDNGIIITYCGASYSMHVKGYELNTRSLCVEKQYHKLELTIKYDDRRVLRSVNLCLDYDEKIEIEIYYKSITADYTKTKRTQINLE